VALEAMAEATQWVVEAMAEDIQWVEAMEDTLQRVSWPASCLAFCLRLPLILSCTVLFFIYFYCTFSPLLHPCNPPPTPSHPNPTPAHLKKLFKDGFH
jgi:hypothetical protein